jgi:hypothetical protein
MLLPGVDCCIERRCRVVCLGAAGVVQVVGEALPALQAAVQQLLL